MKELVWNNKITRHVLFWMVFFVFTFITDPIESVLSIQVIGTTLIMLNYIVSYYLQFFFIFPQFFQKKATLLLLLILLFLLYVCFDIFIFRFFLESHLASSEFSNGPLYNLILSDFITFAIVSTISLGAYQNKKEMEEVKRNTFKEKALISKEINFLRNQFDSHVTFNFLNYCYSRIHKSSDQTAEAIELFSRMLRYSLSNKMDKKVPLKREIEYIENFIALQKLLAAEIQIKFIMETNDYNSIYISPQILIPLVENAFKHGNMHSHLHPIQIELTILNEALNFKVTNEKRATKTVNGSGLGQNNVRQQLDRVYKNQYYLDINDIDNIYSAHLKLMIN